MSAMHQLKKEKNFSLQNRSFSAKITSATVREKCFKNGKIFWAKFKVARARIQQSKTKSTLTRVNRQARQILAILRKMSSENWIRRPNGEVLERPSRQEFLIKIKSKKWTKFSYNFQPILQKSVINSKRLSSWIFLRLPF